MVFHNLKAHATNQDLILNFLRNEKSEAKRTNLLNILFKSTLNLTMSIKVLGELVTICHKIHDKKEPAMLSHLVYRFLESNNGLVKKYHVKIHNEIPEEFAIKAILVYLENIVASLLLKAIIVKSHHKRPVVLISIDTDNGLNVL